MIDLGFVSIHLDALNWLVVSTAVVLAVLYIGVDLLFTVGGVIAAIVSLSSLVYDRPFEIAGYTLGTYLCWTVLILSTYAAYHGARRVMGD